MRQSGSFLMTFPASNMVSLKLHNRVSGQACEPLHRFLTACVNLKELALYDLKSPFEPTGGRLPASPLHGSTIMAIYTRKCISGLGLCSVRGNGSSLASFGPNIKIHVAKRILSPTLPED